jgi:hypothetical protein
MDIKLLKELNEMSQEQDEFALALKEAEMELGMDLGDDDEFGDMEDDDPDNFDYDSVDMNDDELQRIADHWEEEGSDMEDDDLADAIGDDLEQLEYSPEEISAGIMKVMSMLGRDDYFGEPSDEELDDIESDQDFDPDEEFPEEF